MQMTGTVIDTTAQGLLIRNDANGQNVMVMYRNPRRFNVGDRVRVTYSGVMTMSVPPQITATNIQLLSRPPVNPPRPPVTPPRPPVLPPIVQPIIPPIFTPREMRAQVIRRERDFLIVRNVANNQILRVDTPDARFFCAGRQVNIRFSAIIPGLPPRVDAISVLPVC